MSVGQIPRVLGRYVLYDQIASGGMATVHFGRMHGAIGFARLVAIKRLHPKYVHDDQFVQMFLDEARLAARLDHPNVVHTLDVVADETEVFLVMEYVLGEALEAVMVRDGRPRMPPAIASAIVCNVLEGLHSAHEARGDTGEPLAIVHRDVSPQNILVGVDGVARVFDFGIAKTAMNTQETREGVIKGKVTYMAPEQVLGPVDRRADLYAAGVILWELIAGRRRHAGERNDSLFLKLARNELEPPLPLTSLRTDVSFELDAVVARATDPDPEGRFDTAREMAVALEAAVPPAPARAVGEWLREIAAARIERVTHVMRRIETDVQFGVEPSVSSIGRAVSSGTLRAVSTSPSPLASVTMAPNGSPSIAAPDVVLIDESAMPPPPRNWTLLAALIAFVAGLFLVGVRAVIRHDVSRSAPAIEAKVVEPSPLPIAFALASSSASATPSIVDAGPPRVVVAPPPPVVQPPPRAVYVAPPPPVARVPRETPPTPATRVEPAAPPATSAGHKHGCESPFAIGPDGIRQIKPECL
jgi:serine/threonine protein kinase